MSNSFKTCDNRQNVNTHENIYWWSGTNYEPVCHMPNGSEMVPCLLGYFMCTYKYIQNSGVTYLFILLLGGQLDMEIDSRM